jgi:hypothetical protein
MYVLYCVVLCRTFYAWLPLWGPILAMLHLSRSRVHKADDYDTTSHRHRQHGASPDKKRAGARGRRSPGHGGEVTERLLGGVECGTEEGEDDARDEDVFSEDEGGGGHSLAPGQFSQHSHLSGQSAASGSTLGSAPRSGSASASVYRPPDYPSSLFRQAADDSGGEEDEESGDFRDDASSDRSDSMYLDDRSSSQYTGGRTTNTSSSLLSADHLDGNGPHPALRHLSGVGMGREQEQEEEERGSSADDYQHQYQYASCFSGDHGNDLQALSLHSGLGTCGLLRAGSTTSSSVDQDLNAMH